MPGQYVVISDKDGGLAAELRSPKGDIPVFVSPSGDRTYWQEPISITTTGANTIHTPASGKRFNLETLVMAVGESGDVQLRSDTTNISGRMNLAANGVIAIDHSGIDDRAKLKGVAIENPFVINVTTIKTAGGYATGYDE